MFVLIRKRLNYIMEREEKNVAKKGKKEKNPVEALLDSKMLGVDGKERLVKDLFVKDDFETSRENKTDVFVRHDALRGACIVAFNGIKNRAPKTLSQPKKMDDFCVSAEVVYTFGNNLKVGDAADCSTKTAYGKFRSYTTALAVTRASSRALRFALGLKIPSFEEIANVENIVDLAARSKADPQQLALIRKKFLKPKSEGGKGKTRKDVEFVLGRKVRTLHELTQADASDVLTAFNSEKEDD